MSLLKYILLSFVAIFAPIKMLIITVGVLIFTDLILGILAAKKRKETITSAALRRTVTKMFVFQAAILTGYLLEVYLLDSIIPITKLVAAVIGTTEFVSILENTSELTGLNFTDIIKKLGSKNDEK